MDFENRMDKEIKLDGRYLDVLSLYKQGYCCSQIMAILMLRSQGRNAPDLVRALGGLCDGLGHSGEICGVVSGGLCLLHLCAGKGAENEASYERLPLMCSELMEWFRDRTQGEYGGATCDDILTRSPDRRACIRLIVETYEKVLSILETSVQ